MKKFIMYALLFINLSAHSQDLSIDYFFPPTNPKSGNCGELSQSFLDFYKLQSSFNPKTNSTIDLIKIPINIIVLAKTDSTEGAYTPTEFSNEIYKFSWLNRSYTTTSLPSDPCSGFPSSYWLTTTNIQFELNQVYFYYNTTIVMLS